MNNMFGFIQMMRDPQQMIDNMMKDGQMMNNPMMKNAFEMARKGDEKGLSDLVHNVGKQKGVDVDSIFQQLKRFR